MSSEADACSKAKAVNPYTNKEIRYIPQFSGDKYGDNHG